MKNFILSHKRIFIVVLAFLSISSYLFITPFAKSNGGSFYSGDAISYDNKVIIGTVNRDNLEIFEIVNGKIERLSLIKNQENVKKFYDLAFARHNDRLYVYLVDGRYFYKYDITDRRNPLLIKKIKDNSWDWFTGVQVSGDRVATIGKNIKIWNHDMQVVDSFNGVGNIYPYNISFNPAGDFIFNIKEESVQIYDTYLRSDYSAFSPNFKQAYNRKLYYDQNMDSLFVVDDNSISRYNLDKSKKRALKVLTNNHIAEHGYDVAALPDSKYLYFSDGIGIVKAKKDNLEFVDWIRTGLIGTKFSWAQGLNVVKVANREVIISFCINGILALNDEMGVIDYYEISGQNTQEKKNFISEELYLKLDKPLVYAGGKIKLSGGGFAAREDLEISYLGVKKALKSDQNGRFSIDLDIPKIDPIYTAIDVLGKTSNSRYGISLDIR
jgi:hypothetical protein